MMCLLWMVRGALIILRLTRPGPSVGSSCQHILRHSSLLHRALHRREGDGDQHETERGGNERE